MCNANRVRRHIASSANCSACNNPSKTTLHVLRDCEQALKVWRQFMFSGKLERFQASYLKDWLRKNLKKPADWGSRFAFAVWFIWRWRNLKVFDNSTNAPADKVSFIVDSCKEYALMEDKKVGLVKGKVFEESFWKMPAMGWFKLNKDGCYRAGELRTYAGGILRDEEGAFVCGFTAKAAGDTSVGAEILGLIHGLEMAKEKGIQRLEVEMDSQEVVKVIISRKPLPPLFHLQLQRGREMLGASDWEARIRYVPRCCNMLADKLARAAHMFEEDIKYCHAILEFLESVANTDMLMNDIM